VTSTLASPQRPDFDVCSILRCNRAWLVGASIVDYDCFDDYGALGEYTFARSPYDRRALLVWNDDGWPTVSFRLSEQFAQVSQWRFQPTHHSALSRMLPGPLPQVCDDLIGQSGINARLYLIVQVN
jgi:hypothetical protein